MADPIHPEPRDPDPRDVSDLPLQPTGSGVADTEIAMMQAAVADDTAEAGIADETAGYDRAMRADDDVPTKTQA